MKIEVTSILKVLVMNILIIKSIPEILCIIFLDILFQVSLLKHYKSVTNLILVKQELNN